VWGEFGEEEFEEVLVGPDTKEGPNILVGKVCGECGELELEEVVLCGVHVDCVNTAGGAVEDVAEDVVTSGGDCEDGVIWGDFQQAVVHLGILPGEGVDVIIVELGMLGVELVVVDAPGVILVEGGREGQVGGEVEDGYFEAFAAELLLLEGGGGVEGGEVILEVGRGEVW